jgi:hypothetical protein
VFEHQMIWGAQKLAGQGVSIIADNIEDPSAILQAGKATAGAISYAWDSIKCGYEYVSEFVGAQFSGESETSDHLVG